MIANIDILVLSLAAVVGALFTGVLGFLASGEPFDPRKFASTILRAIIAAIAIAVTFSFEGDLDAVNLLLAFLAGAGIDVAGSRLAGVITPAPAPVKPAA
jgi:hypothetical protein